MFLIKNFNYSYSPIKLILTCGETKINNLLTNFLVENYNFLNYKDFFEEFAKLTSFLHSYNILVKVLLFIPDIKSDQNSYYFIIKSFESSFFIKNFLINDYIINPLTKKIIIKLDFIILIKICLILSFYNYINYKTNLLLLNNFKLFIKSFIGYLFSFQFFFFNLDKNLTLIHKKNFNFNFL